MVSRRVVVQDTARMDLYWWPLGAGEAPRVVRWSGGAYEAIVARHEHREVCSLFHSALEIQLGTDHFVVEMAPVWQYRQPDRGVVSEGAVGLPWLGRSRLFRYEVRCWRNGIIPDAADAVASLVRPDQRVSVASLTVHNLRQTDLADAPGIDDVLDDLIDLLAHRVLVAHAAWFEQAFLNRALHRWGRSVGRAVIDTAALARACGLAPAGSSRDEHRGDRPPARAARPHATPRARRRRHGGGGLPRCSDPAGATPVDDADEATLGAPAVPALASLLELREPHPPSRSDSCISRRECIP